MSTETIMGDPIVGQPQSGSTPRVLPVVITRWVKSFALLCVSLVLSFAAWVAIFTVLVTGVASTIIWVGIPIIAVAFGLAHLYARAKKAMNGWLGTAPLTELPQVSREHGLWNWVKAEIHKPERWREMAYGLIGSVADWVLALIPFVLLLTGICGIAASLFLPWASSTVGASPDGGVGVTFFGEPQPYSLSFRLGWAAVGCVALIVGVILVIVCAHAQAAVTRFFLAPSRRATEARLAKAEQAKALGEQAEAQSLTRIERDLHDGPQQSLIRSSLDLATLDRRLAEGDVTSAQELVADIRSRNDATLADIRALSRGFAPPVLVEKGLREAVVSLAATSTIPVSVSTELTGPRMPEPVERAVYFAISEGLANVAKHSGATTATVHVVRGATAVQAEIADNGKGGAVSLPGHGLDGLANRLASVSGSLVIDSLPGEGTKLLIEVPLG